ncbi:hypothetical protein HPP92_023220 [Vanilla planifolia]|uniref:MYND-type domain-containing protein n=1 Tax=Vanilla planifolia TaxID=51239 RepID=A0A835UE96_VANPL|nr:hypothetical protein HPP92_023220 [Vanilla planifolia]
MQQDYGVNCTAILEKMSALESTVFVLGDPCVAFKADERVEHREVSCQTGVAPRFSSFFTTAEESANLEGMSSWVVWTWLTNTTSGKMMTWALWLAFESAHSSAYFPALVLSARQRGVYRVLCGTLTDSIRVDYFLFKCRVLSLHSESHSFSCQGKLIYLLFCGLGCAPVVTYIILGIWNEASKKKAKISLLTQIPSEETPSDEVMASTDLPPLIPPSSFGTHVCAKCFAPATTRCSRCKSVRYCSGKCQILHWRQGHKQECQQWPNGIANSSCAEPIRDSVDRISFMNGSRLHIGGYIEEVQHSDILSDLSDCAEDLSLDTHIELKSKAMGREIMPNLTKKLLDLKVPMQPLNPTKPVLILDC